MKKQWVFITVLFIVVVGLILWFQFVRSQKQALLPTPTPTPALESVQPLPDRQSFPSILPGTTFTFVGPEKPVPESITTYKIGAALADSELNSLANLLSKQLGFTASASAGIIKGNFVFVINEGARSFYLTRNAAGTNLSYQVRLAAQNQLQTPTPDVIADNFIHQLNIFPSSYTTSPLGQQPTVGEDILVKDIPPPKIYAYGFGLLLNNIPILTPQYSFSWGLVAVDGRGLVRLAKVAFPFSAPSPGGNIKIVSLENALRGLSVGKGALVRMTSLNKDYFDVAPAFTNGVVSDFTIVYVAAENRLVPAYRFLGTGVTPEGKTQSFEAVVLAIAQP